MPVAPEMRNPDYFGRLFRMRCMSLTFIFMPPGMVMSPGFWSALQGPTHFAFIVMLVSAGMPGGPPELWLVTFTV
jgi:hypothetical protein